MKCALLAFGTRGDVQPFVVLARALEARGHDAWLAAPTDMRGFVEGAGVRFVPLPAEARAFLESEEGKQLLASGHVLEIARRMAAFVHSIRDPLDAAIEHACDGAELVVAHVLMADRVACVCEARNLKLAVLSTIPLAPTGAWESPMIDAAVPTAVLKRASHHLAHRIFYAMARADVNHLRKRLQQPPVTKPIWISLRSTATPVFLAHSPALLPTPSDMADNVFVTGALVPDAGMRIALGERALPADVESFLGSGPPPFFIGFGSMPIVDVPATMRMTLAALDAVDGRAIIGAGWSRLPPDLQSARVVLVKDVDHDTLLPRCAAMVHHGGVGTTHAALRAGLPAAVLSVFGDQPFWGRVLQAYGLGVHRRFRRTTARVLTDVLTALRDDGMRARTRAVGDAMRAEDGAAVLCAHLERCATTAPVPRLA